MEPGTIVVMLVLLALFVSAVPLRRRSTEAPSRHRDKELHRRRADAAAQMESHDIDDMLDAIDEHRRHSGRRTLAEELGDEALRSTWQEP